MLFFPRLSCHGWLSNILFPHLNRSCHRVDRMLGFFSSRMNWEPPPLHLTPGECVPPPFGSGGGGGGTHSLAEDGVVGSQCGLRTRGQTQWYSIGKYVHYVVAGTSTCLVLDLRKPFKFRKRLLGGEM